MKAENKKSDHDKNMILILQKETIIKVYRKCEMCNGVVDMYDKFTEEEHCQNCGWY